MHVSKGLSTGHCLITHVCIILQTLGEEDVISVFKSNQKATANMIESFKPLLTSGKKKEVRKVIRKAFALIDTAGGEKQILGKCAAQVKDIKAMLDQNA